MLERPHFLSIDDVSAAETLRLLDLADAIEGPGRAAHRLDDRIMVTLFAEPSTRTRLSFESAMHRLGGRVVTVAEPSSSSLSKGETIADSARIVSAYGDLLVMRHPWSGAARAAAETSRVPVINAGDGGHEHPTQTLVDLLTLRRKLGRLEGLTVALWGDLKFGRTTHSLAAALLRLGNDVVALAEPSLALPESVHARCAAIRGVEVTRKRCRAAGALAALDGLSAVVMTAAGGARGGAGELLDLGAVAFDALYATRLQKERLPPAQRAAGPTLPRIDRALLDHPALRSAIVLHPLPRVGEIDARFDVDPRAAYFDQAALGVPMRMALVAAALSPTGAQRLDVRDPRTPSDLDAAAACVEEVCVAVREPVSAPRRFWRDGAGCVRCWWCDEAAG
jgi:aspartate carbamoyltransferase catalytic subunit